MKTTVTLNTEQLQAVKHHVDRTELHNTAYPLDNNEGKLFTRSKGRLDYLGNALIDCPCCGIQSLHKVEGQNDQFNNGTQYLFVGLKPIDIEVEPEGRRPPKADPLKGRSTKAVPAAKKTSKKGGGA